MEPIVTDSISKGEALRHALECEAVFADVLIGVLIGIIATVISFKIAK